jgi:flagellar biosynthesis/type III secretory pathway protein FliH
MTWQRIPRDEVRFAYEPVTFAAASTQGEGPAPRRLEEGCLALSEDELSTLVMRALRLLVREELSLRPEHVRARIHVELVRLRLSRALELRVHPDDHSLLPSEAALCAAADIPGELRIVSDPSLARGDCLLRSDLGSVDARIVTQLDALTALVGSRS